MLSATTNSRPTFCFCCYEYVSVCLSVHHSECDLLLWVCVGLSVCSSQWVWSVAMSVCLSVCWWQRVGGTDNLSCLLVLPPHRGAGYTQLMIALSKYMSHVHLTQRFCWSLPRCNCELSWKWLNQSRCRLGSGLGWAVGIMYWVGAQISQGKGHFCGCPCDVVFCWNCLTTCFACMVWNCKSSWNWKWVFLACRLPAVSSVAVRWHTWATCQWRAARRPRVLLEIRRRGFPAEIPHVIPPRWTHRLRFVSLCVCLISDVVHFTL